MSPFAFDALLHQYGRSVIYVKRNLQFRCSCYVERSGEATLNCYKCLGTGYVTELIKWNVRSRQGNIPLSMPNAFEFTSMGHFGNEAHIYYSAPSLTPAIGDYVLEVQWDKERPMRIMQKMIISFVDPKMFEQNELLFYQSYARKMVVNEGDDHILQRY